MTILSRYVELHPASQALAKRALAAVLVMVIAAGTVIAQGANAAAATGSAPKRPSSTSATSKKSSNPLPVMKVTDVKTGKDVALAASLDGKKPLLVWFWAPH